MHINEIVLQCNSQNVSLSLSDTGLVLAMEITLDWSFSKCLLSPFYLQFVECFYHGIHCVGFCQNLFLLTYSSDFCLDSIAYLKILLFIRKAVILLCVALLRYIPFWFCCPCSFWPISGGIAFDDMLRGPYVVLGFKSILAASKQIP